MTFSKSSRKLPPRDAALAYEDVGPGLYQDETVVEIGTGETVAVSVERRWLPNNGGIAFMAWARLIEDDGSTRRTGNRAEVETVLPYSCTPHDLEAFGVEALAREGLLAVLGEAPTMVPIAPAPADAAHPEIATSEQDYRENPWKAPPGFVHYPDMTERPMIGWSAEARLNSSILHAISSVTATENDDLFSAAALLGLERGPGNAADRSRRKAPQKST
jgi:hypothetical protein